MSDTKMPLKELPVGLTLEPDYLSIPGQSYALVSFIGPEYCSQKSDRFAMKIRGVFATEEEAGAHVKRLQRSGDNSVDIFLVSMYNWVPCPPNPMEIETQEYQEEFLQDLMKGYAESQRSAKELFHERKERVMKEGLDANLLPEERIPPPSEPLSAPAKLPKLQIETITEETEKVDDEAGTSQVVDKMFNQDDPWSANKKN
ncbi:hypothetical protein PBCVNY2B_651R [Paramecium bursaria Chlorella virus NY2B]|uniref:Uncharacterized protein n=1 Tax=Paramecium bursaria Chlorella virus NYs1 TaxID=83442 RepID=M1IJZ1_9PHYC|nr:hypothetical protein AR158_C575R [Paramecium bursaria Chlorella virus AR158]YP_009665475.1 hypothetical protein FK949_gp295 [Paramecium bursaria Chlorella virus NYs1]AGE54329.1 hypothetical protein PBCVIL52s1_668R [Paramecium bursaria Chlorella virus IL-5-2s1]AGE55015.1 hypothetical protein PBCVMA1D_655R [Paramecium bursaria Chlorella virus MA1D]AGE58447.1 hypothetical protein PBCVNY2B_651R [Paramecium bursaria Chlorella virus NY2B]ABU44120.1 hypothetical protein AR158_C575R [Paramecium bur